MYGVVFPWINGCGACTVLLSTGVVLQRHAFPRKVERGAGALRDVFISSESLEVERGAVIKVSALDETKQHGASAR